MSWARVRGHEGLVRAFQQVLERGRLAHAYLFVGPEGVGKKLFAVELAKALLCEQPQPDRPWEGCDVCPACVQVESITHPDYQLVGLPEDKHEFPIALVQEVRRNLAMKPARGKHRVAILDDADQLNDESANCFLKTLEEPPPASLLILIGTSPDRQLPTIISRCQVIRFAPLPIEIVAEQLLAAGIVSDLAEAQRLAELSGRSPGAARVLGNAEVGKFRLELLEALTQPKLDAVGLAQRLVQFVEEGAKDSAIKRQRAGLVLQFLTHFFQLVLLCQLSQPANALDPQELALARKLAGRVSVDHLLRLLERCLEADYQSERRVQLVLVLEAFADAVGQCLVMS